MSSQMSFTDNGRILFILQKDGEADDRLIVSPDSNTKGYHVRFEQRTIENVVENFVDNVDLPNYLYRFFSALLFDQLPYKNVQIDCPSYPTVWMKCENVLAYLTVLYSQIASMQDDWPAEYSGKSNMPKESQVYTGDARLFLVFQTKNKKDDILTVSPASGGYQVRFEQKNLFNVTTRFVTTCGIHEYLDGVYRAILADEDPYTAIQVDCPMYPTVVFKREMLSSYSTILYDQIYSLQKSWPTEHSGKAKKVQNVNLEPVDVGRYYDGYYA